MKNDTITEALNAYKAPSLRIIGIDLETAYLQSNLEPIGGGDDPDIDW